jgi:hypothetical protein
VDVVRIDITERRVANPHRYVRTAA